MALWSEYRQLVFFQAMSRSCASGLNPAKALELACKGVGKSRLQALAEHVRAGGTLADAMALAPDFFPTWQREVVRVGETTGRLDQSFHLIAELLEERRAFWLAIAPLLLYPAFLLHFAALIFAYGGVSFGSAHETPFLIALVKFLAPFYIAGGAVWLLWKLIAESRLACALPIVGTFRKASFAFYLATFVKAAVPYPKAMPLALRASRLRPRAGWNADGQEGRPFWEQVDGLGLFSKSEISQIASAEESGSLDETLRQLAAQWRAGGQAMAKGLAQILPVVLYVIVALYIGRKILDYYSGYFKEIDSLR